MNEVGMRAWFVAMKQHHFEWWRVGKAGLVDKSPRGAGWNVVRFLVSLVTRCARCLLWAIIPADSTSSTMIRYTHGYYDTCEIATRDTEARTKEDGDWKDAHCCNRLLHMPVTFICHRPGVGVRPPGWSCRCFSNNIVSFIRQGSGNNISFCKRRRQRRRSVVCLITAVEEEEKSILDKINSFLDTPILDANDRSDQGPIAETLKRFVRREPQLASVTFSVVVVAFMFLLVRVYNFIAYGIFWTERAWGGIRWYAGVSRHHN